MVEPGSCSRCNRTGIAAKIKFVGFMVRGYQDQSQVRSFVEDVNYPLCAMCVDSFDSWMSGIYGQGYKINRPVTKDIWGLM